MILFCSTNLDRSKNIRPKICRDDQNGSRYSNRFRVVSDVVGDDFMQFGRRTDVKQVPSRLAAPHEATWTRPATTAHQRDMTSFTEMKPSWRES